MRLVLGIFYLGLICKTSASIKETDGYPKRSLMDDDNVADDPPTSTSEVCLADTWKPNDPTSCYRPPTQNSPQQEDIISTFNRTLFKEIRSRKALKDQSYFRLSSCMSEEFLYNTASYLLDHAGVPDDCLSGILARSVGSIGTLASDFYIQSSSNTVSKFLLSKGVLNAGNVVGLARAFADFLEQNAGRVGLRDPETFIQTVGTSVVDFVDTLGLYFASYYTPLYVLFIHEYVSEESCACLFD